VCFQDTTNACHVRFKLQKISAWHLLQEVLDTKDESALFRQNSTATKASVPHLAICLQHPDACLFQLVTAFSRKVASSYLVQTLSGVIHSILDGPVMELDVADGVDVSYQVLILGGKCSQVFQYFSNVV
jgi:hypothetical protein